MKNYIFKKDIVFPVEFYDVDSMRIVWHGNYVKYMEKARCALLEELGYGYLQMEESGYLFPIVDVKLKYKRSLRYGETARVSAYLLEYENCIKIAYEIFNNETGELTTRGESTQMAVRKDNGETCFLCPEVFTSKVKEIRKA